MKKLLFHRPLYVYLVIGVIGAVGYMMFALGQGEPVALTTTIVERGTVERLVSVSGVVEAEQTAELAFPTSGIVSTVDVSLGDVVAQGDILITLEARELAADRVDALAARSRAVATRDELTTGADSNTRAASAESVTLKETTLSNTRATQAEIIQNARRALLSSDLAAVTTDGDETALAPRVTGTYTCDTEGTYTLETYASNADSGYSFRFSGIESGTAPVTTQQATSLGTCGLRTQFDPTSRYADSTWTIQIPNPKSTQYVTNRNAYALAQIQSDSAIALAQQDVALAIANETSTNAPARSEAIARANADIASANARIARIDAQIANRVMRAPFAGTITSVDIFPGETVNTAPVITLLAESDFELTARIPEIDIGKLALGQTVRSVFDALPDETLTGSIEFISLKATEIDGVAYYEAIITMEQTPVWLRSGLNADIDIIVAQATDTQRVPARYVTTDDTGSSVLTRRGDLVATTTVDIVLQGNDGFVAVTGLNDNEVIVSP